MDLLRVSEMPAGSKANVLVEVHSSLGGYVLGHEIPYGESVAFRFEGHLDQRMMLYDAKKTDQMLHQHCLLELDPGFVPIGVANPCHVDFLYTHDTLCGLGGFSFGVQCFVRPSCIGRGLESPCHGRVSSQSFHPCLSGRHWPF